MNTHDTSKTAVTAKALPDKIGRIPDRNAAFWHIAALLAAHPRFATRPLATLRSLQQSITQNSYCCLGDGKTPLRAVATWRGVNAAALKRSYPKYAAGKSEPTDGVFLTALAATDRESLKLIVAHLKNLFAAHDVFWDRHKGKLGHREKQSSD